MAPMRVLAAVVSFSCPVLGLRKGARAVVAPVKTSGSEDGYIIAFKAGTTNAMIEEYCANSCYYQGSPDQGGIPFALVQGTQQAAAEGMFKISTVADVEDDVEVEDDPMEEMDESIPSLAAASSQSSWSLDRIGAKQSRAKGRGVNIYVLDSGVRATHREFVGRVVPTWHGFQRRACQAQDYACSNDRYGHGSHVAGSAAGTTYGVAPLATIHAAIRGGSMSNAIAAMDYIVQSHVKPAVLTMSFGNPGTSSAAELAVDTVLSAGITVTVAAGNRGWDGCDTCFTYMKGVIAVANSDQQNARSSSSNYGSCVDIFAPGTAIVSASHMSDTGSSTMGGTSMAAPHVAGAVALILESSPSMSPQQVKDTLKQSATTNVITDQRGSPNLLLNVASF